MAAWLVCVEYTDDQDTEILWSVLAFQPEFTATSSNIGYGWWSHDIGGHHHGITVSRHSDYV